EGAELSGRGIDENQVALSISNRLVAETRIESLRCCDILNSWVGHLLQSREVGSAVFQPCNLTDVLRKLPKENRRVVRVLYKRRRARSNGQRRARSPFENSSQLPLFDQPRQPSRTIGEKRSARPERQFVRPVTANRMRAMEVYERLV